jgi:hypothetical protein
MWVISVSKTYKHRGKNIKHRHDTKKHWQVMYYDYNEYGKLELHSIFVNPVQAMYYKLIKCSQRKFYCPHCGNSFLVLVQKNIKQIECPYCEL